MVDGQNIVKMEIYILKRVGIMEENLVTGTGMTTMGYFF